MSAPTSTIRTAEELAALPKGTVVRESGGIVSEWDGRTLAGTDGGWWMPGDPYLVTAFPMTVLHRPDLPTQADLHAAVERVRALHAPTRCDHSGDCINGRPHEACLHCADLWPCLTIRVLDTGEGL